MWRKNKGIKTLSISLDFNNKRTRIHCKNCIFSMDNDYLKREKMENKTKENRVHIEFTYNLNVV